MRVTLLVAVLLVSVSLVSAQTPPCTTVHHSGLLVLRMRVGVGDETPHQRAVAVYQELVDAMSWVFASQKPLDPDAVVIKRACAPYRYAVWCGPIRIVGVTKADGEANGCCAQQLADRWAKNIRAALLKATHDC